MYTSLTFSYFRHSAPSNLLIEQIGNSHWIRRIPFSGGRIDARIFGKETSFHIFSLFWVALWTRPSSQLLIGHSVGSRYLSAANVVQVWFMDFFLGSSHTVQQFLKRIWLQIVRLLMHHPSCICHFQCWSEKRSTNCGFTTRRFQILFGPWGSLQQFSTANGVVSVSISLSFSWDQVPSSACAGWAETVVALERTWQVTLSQSDEHSKPYTILTLSEQPS